MIHDAITWVAAAMFYLVHSMNPVGAENIRKYMENFLKAYNND
jgi:hypothetical protein